MQQSNDVFKEKVQSMKASEIIRAMARALIHPPVIAIDMSTFGEVRHKRLFKFLPIPFKKVCFGCAATNAICEISGKKFTTHTIDKRADFLNTDPFFLTNFEYAINALRSGNINDYNERAEMAGFARISVPIDSVSYMSLNWVRGGLPYLGDNYTEYELSCYFKLADMQRKREEEETLMGKKNLEISVESCILQPF